MLAIDCRTSLAESVAAKVPGANVIKAFNAVTAQALEYVIKSDRPVIHGQPVTVLYYGDDDASKWIASGLIGELNFEAIDVGGLPEAPFSNRWEPWQSDYVKIRDLALS